MADSEAIHIKSILERLPSSPGVYQMLDKDGKVIYIGKAKNLQKRVRSYFLKQKNRAAKVEKMVSEICDIKYIEVTSELEALVLETNYIKEYKPRFNILMRDDKNYQYIKITKNEDYPRVYTTRRLLKDGALYFGPKTSSSSVYQTLKLLRKLFPYRTCNLEINDLGDSVEIKNKTIKIPCIYYHIKRCLGPCIKPCKNEYDELIKNMADFLSGEYKDIVLSLEKKMAEQANNRKYEHAAKTRDMIYSVKNLMEKQLVDQADISKSQDIIGCTKKIGKIFINLFQIRYGKLIGQENFVLEDSANKDDNIMESDEVLQTFLLQYYDAATSIPKEIILPEEITDKDLIETWLENRHPGQKIKLHIPQRGTKNHLVELAEQNAISYAEQYRIKWQTDQSRTKGALKVLAEAIDLPSELKRIECYDISHLSGTSTVGSMVVFKDGLPSKKDYRRFKVRQTKEGEIDDFKSLQEVLSRRLKRIKEQSEEEHEGESLYEIPDLIIIDGGKGQLSSVMEIAEKLEVGIPIVSLAKREEEIFLPGQSIPILLPRESEALYLIQNIRDEAHRFAITYNRNLRSKNLIKSLLDEVPGVGPVVKKKLLKAFGDLNGIKQATEEQVAEIIGPALAHTVKEYI
ncbi:MAG: excinuclease ABC subunit UvrC [Candidatus Gracilibacteria bacterium]